jgi:hypothetical protein
MWVHIYRDTTTRVNSYVSFIDTAFTMTGIMQSTDCWLRGLLIIYQFFYTLDRSWWLWLWMLSIPLPVQASQPVEIPIKKKYCRWWKKCQWSCSECRTYMSLDHGQSAFNYPQIRQVLHSFSANCHVRRSQCPHQLHIGAIKDRGRGIHN